VSFMQCFWLFLVSYFALLIFFVSQINTKKNFWRKQFKLETAFLSKFFSFYTITKIMTHFKLDFPTCLENVKLWLENRNIFPIKNNKLKLEFEFDTFASLSWNKDKFTENIHSYLSFFMTTDEIKILFWAFQIHFIFLV
jgi:hypothetical protein